LTQTQSHVLLAVNNNNNNSGIYKALFTNRPGALTKLAPIYEVQLRTVWHCNSEVHNKSSIVSRLVCLNCQWLSTSLLMMMTTTN